MLVDVLTEITIGRDRHTVAAFAANPDNAPLWYANIKSVAWKTAPVLEVGARVAFVARFLGRRLEYTYEIAEWTPDEKLVMRTAEGPFPMETTYRWYAVGDDCTRMELRNSGEPTGFAGVVAPIMVRAMKAANRKDLQKLRDVLSAEPEAQRRS